jgi:hypothetical protein
LCDKLGYPFIILPFNRSFPLSYFFSLDRKEAKDQVSPKASLRSIFCAHIPRSATPHSSVKTWAWFLLRPSRSCLLRGQKYLCPAFAHSPASFSLIFIRSSRSDRKKKEIIVIEVIYSLVQNKERKCRRGNSFGRKSLRLDCAIWNRGAKLLQDKSPVRQKAFPSA